MIEALKSTFCQTDVMCGTVLEVNRIYNESNLDTMKRMSDNFVDLTVTSPPYDGLRTYNGYSFPFENIAKELFRVTKEGGVVVWVVSDGTIEGEESGTSFKQALYFKECGFKLYDTMIYHRQAGNPPTNKYWQNFEYMFILTKGTPKSVNILRDRKNKYLKMGGDNVRQKDGSLKKGDRGGIQFNENGIRENIWYYAVGKNCSSIDEVAFEHPAIFPEKLAEDHILSWSNENDIVYDCFGGSGTVAKMAHKWKRNWILSEISSEYVKIAEKRIAPYLAQTSLF